VCLRRLSSVQVSQYQRFVTVLPRDRYTYQVIQDGRKGINVDVICFAALVA
jgi:hypothetical protein